MKTSAHKDLNNHRCIRHTAVQDALFKDHPIHACVSRGAQAYRGWSVTLPRTSQLRAGFNVGSLSHMNG